MGAGMSEFVICKICLGTGAKAKKEDYDRWKRHFKRAIDLVAEKGEPKSVLDRAKKRLEKILKAYPPCSFCNGEGGFNKSD
jgi:RecJ-like exonuclease